jgi:hypothetical protein
MGTFYSLGIVTTFTAKPSSSLTAQTLEQAVSERLDLELFDVEHQNGNLQGTLKSGLLQENLGDFCQKLKAIANGDKKIDYYFNEFGTNLENYPLEYCSVYFRDYENNEIKLQMYVLFLFIEGKVGADEFSIEPLLINWLFRHSSFDNPLAGAVMSDIIG